MILLSFRHIPVAIPFAVWPSASTDNPLWCSRSDHPTSSNHLGARNPFFGEAALSAFSTRMASSTKSRSWLLHSWMHFQSISHRLGMVSSSQSNNKEPYAILRFPITLLTSEMLIPSRLAISDRLIPPRNGPLPYIFLIISIGTLSAPFQKVADRRVSEFIVDAPYSGPVIDG